MNEKKNTGTFDYFEFGLRGYIDRLLLRVRAEIFQIFMSEFAPTEKDLILDVGVSEDNHASSNYFEKKYPHTHNITAVGIHDLRELETQFQGLKFVEADGRQLPFPDRSFDYVYSHAVIEHVGSREKQESFIRELVRVARKGVMVTTPNRLHPIEPHTGLPLLHYLPMKVHHKLYRLLGKSTFASEETLNLLTPGVLEQLVEKAGVNHRVRHKWVRWLGFKSNIVLIIEPKP